MAIDVYAERRTVLDMTNAPPTAPAFAILPPRYATCTVRPPRLTPPRRLEVAPSGLVTFATSMSFAGDDDRATAVPAGAQ